MLFTTSGFNNVGHMQDNKTVCHSTSLKEPVRFLPLLWRGCRKVSLHSRGAAVERMAPRSEENRWNAPISFTQMRERGRRCLAEEEEDDKAATCMGLVAVYTFKLLIQSTAPKAIFSLVSSAPEAYLQAILILSHKLEQPLIIKKTPKRPTTNTKRRRCTRNGMPPEFH